MKSHRRLRSRVWAWGLTLALAVLVGACEGEQYEKEAPPVAPSPEPTPVPEPTVAPEPEPEADAEPEAETPGEPAPESEPGSEDEPDPELEPADAEPEPAEEPATEASAEGLTLTGVVQAGRSPAALIEYRGSQEMFRSGDPVFGQGTVEEVRSDTVVIATETGQKITLALAETEAEAPLPTPEPASVAAQPPAAEPAPPPVRQSISRAEAQQAIASFADLLNQAGAEKTEAGDGIHLAEVKADGFLGRLGLKSGDVLQRIGGVTVRDPSALPDLSGAARGSEISVHVVRDEIGLTFSRPLR